MKTIFINLDRSEDRRAHFLDVNHHLTDVERFPAVDGSALDRDDLIRRGLIADRDLDYTPGALGCAMSHRALWLSVADNKRALTIAEDDAILSYFFEERRHALIRQVDPDWDFILWGWGVNNYLWVNLLPNAIVSEIRLIESLNLMNLDRFQSSRRPTVLMPLVHGVGFVCYSISPRGAKKLLERCFPLRNEIIPLRHSGIRVANTGIDCTANDVYPEMKSYACVAPLATVDYKVPSTIR